MRLTFLERFLPFKAGRWSDVSAGLKGQFQLCVPG